MTAETACLNFEVDQTESTRSGGSQGCGQPDVASQSTRRTDWQVSTPVVCNTGAFQLGDGRSLYFGLSEFPT